MVRLMFSENDGDNFSVEKCHYLNKMKLFYFENYLFDEDQFPY